MHRFEELHYSVISFLSASLWLFPSVKPGLFHLVFFCRWAIAPVCVCRTSETNWHAFAGKCSILTRTCSCDYRLACVQQWVMGCWWTQTGSWHYPALWLRERVEVVEGCRCPFRSNGPSIQSFNWVSFICLQWPLLFSISSSSFPALIHFFFHPPSLPSPNSPPRSCLQERPTSVRMAVTCCFSEHIWQVLRKQCDGELHFQIQINTQNTENRFSLLFPHIFSSLSFTVLLSVSSLSPFGSQLVSQSFPFCFVHSHYHRALLSLIPRSQCPCTQRHENDMHIPDHFPSHLSNFNAKNTISVSDISNPWIERWTVGFITANVFITCLNM